MWCSAKAGITVSIIGAGLERLTGGKRWILDVAGMCFGVALAAGIGDVCLDRDGRFIFRARDVLGFRWIGFGGLFLMCFKLLVVSKLWG